MSLFIQPPGTGKKTLVKAIAAEAECTLFSVSFKDLISAYNEYGWRLLREVFSIARKERPCIVFLDDLDQICQVREGEQDEIIRRVKTEFLVEMQGVGRDNEGFIVIGATNLPWELDGAIRRRFEKRIYISLPEVKAREQMIMNLMKNTKTTLTSEQIVDLSEKTEGFSGSEISNLVRNAIQQVQLQQQANELRIAREDEKQKLSPLNENKEGEQISFVSLGQKEEVTIRDICYNDFLVVIEKNQKFCSKAYLNKFEQWKSDFGQCD